MQGYRDTVKGYRNTGRHGCRDTGIQGYRDKGYRDTGMQGCRDTGIQGYRDTGMQGYRDTGIRGYRDTRIQGYRETGIQEYMDTGMRVAVGPIHKNRFGVLAKVCKSRLPKMADPATKPCMENTILGQLVPRTSLEASVHTYS